MTPEVAETYALKVLGWLVGEEEILLIFMGSSGSSAADIKERAQDADFLIAVPTTSTNFLNKPVHACDLL